MKIRKDIILPPRLRSIDGNEERHAEWLELLYDLVFVAAVSILALNLSSDFSFAGLLKSIPLFFVIWWGWVGHTFYLTRFGTDDLLNRFLTMLQMIAVASLAVNAENAFGTNGSGFAISYATLRFILVLEYYRAGKHLKEAKPLTDHYCKGFGAAAFIWLISAFVPTPFRFVLWVIAMVIDLLTPITAAEEQYKLPPHSKYLPERFGLFTIILIGEAVVSVVFTINDVGFYFLSEVTGIMGLIIAFCIWWSYFEEAKGAEPKVISSGNKISKYQLWLYSHFPLLLGIVTLAAGIKHVINLGYSNFLPVNEAWLLCVALALTFLSLSFIHLSSFSLEECKNKVLIIFRMPYYFTTVLVLLTGFLGSLIPAWAFLGILCILCLIKVVLSLREIPEDLVCEL
ncbi:MAG: low temperature requirement protein A [Methanobacteriales archaeon HGW-Methanobacteriales-1]|jgi:low temperature requirement protein LtrA|nr:MAG: low temperature requirement protein A [Methanobacteriales archaeon HGW-Methanobacteriales-1]